MLPEQRVDALRYVPGLRIEECQGVYPPSEDTLLLLDSLEVAKGEEMLEMGCGSGVISVHCAAAGAKVTSVDLNPAAVQCTVENAGRNGLEVRGIVSDLFSRVTGIYDQIVFNPPYLPVGEKDPLALAWSGGKGGVDVLDRFLRDAPEFLKSGGRMTIVVSSRMDDDLLQAMISRFETGVLAKKRLFFEELEVLSLRVR
jgi:release factor glutamine methyltransferase